jgi:hypothetical protein
MQKEGRKLATPSPVPSRLKKTPGRATLSPKGERARTVRGQCGSSLWPCTYALEVLHSPLSPLGERGRG